MNTELTKTELTKILSALCGKERKPANATVARKAISKAAGLHGVTNEAVYDVADSLVTDDMDSKAWLDLLIANHAVSAAAEAGEAIDHDEKPRRTKKLLVLDMLRRSEGASGQEIMDATGWQKHSVRGFISTCRAKHGIDITAQKKGDRGRVYWLSDNQAEQT